MSKTNREVVDTRGLVTTDLTSSTTIANHLLGLQGAVLAVTGPGNSSRVSRVLGQLNDLADELRRLHL